jgi:hypothetical protein
VVKDVNVKKIPAATPKVIILSLSGMRCADVVRAVKPFKGTGEVAKVGLHNQAPNQHSLMSAISCLQSTSNSRTRSDIWRRPKCQ